MYQTLLEQQQPIGILWIENCNYAYDNWAIQGVEFCMCKDNYAILDLNSVSQWQLCNPRFWRLNGNYTIHNLEFCTLIDNYAIQDFEFCTLNDKYASIHCMTTIQSKTLNSVHLITTIKSRNLNSVQTLNDNCTNQHTQDL